MCVRFNAVAGVASEHFDQRLAPDRGQLAQWLHFSLAIIAPADFTDLLFHPATMRAKPVTTMKICPVQLRQIGRL